MAPERLNGGKYDGRSDVYSAGVLLYEMLTGQVPFFDREQSYFKVVYNHLHTSPTPLRAYRPDLSTKLAALVLCALAKDPAQRPTAQRFRDGLIDLVKVESPALPAIRTAPRVTMLDGSRSARGALSTKAAAELLQQWNAGESDPFIEIVINPDLH